MFFRLLFLLLIALNIGVAAWLAFAPQVLYVPPVTDPGVPELHLLSEGSGPSRSLLPAKRATAKPQTREQVRDERCLSIGPFDTQADTSVAINALTPHVSRVQFRQTQTTQSSGWWVYLPAFPTRDAAIQAARTLSGKGVHDYYVVTAGDRQNTVSLGLFHDPENARRRRDKVAALGFKPDMSERTETLPQYWVDIATPAGKPFDWRAYVTNVAVDAKPASCF